MTSFGWKRKAGGKICKSSLRDFSSQAKDEDETTVGDTDWLMLAPKRTLISLEDAVSKSERLKNEGVLLAEAERFWEAIKKWDEAIQLTPTNETIVEMKTQALMAVGEVYPAVQAAEKTVTLAPTWWIAHQTLGRALANIGEVKLALKSFSRAVHLNPAEPEMWMEDLVWTKSLLERKKLAAESNARTGSTVTIREMREDGSLEENKGDQSLMESRDTGFSTHLPRVPKNYVQMRDTT